MTLQDDFNRFRVENREDHRTLADEHKRGIDAIVGRLDKLNGRVNDNSRSIAVMSEVQRNHGTRLDKADKERGLLFKVVRAIQSSKIKQTAYIAGVITAVTLLLQFGIEPLLRHIFGG